MSSVLQKVALLYIRKASERRDRRRVFRRNEGIFPIEPKPFDRFSRNRFRSRNWRKSES